jgi:hypothetical protein
MYPDSCVCQYTALGWLTTTETLDFLAHLHLIFEALQVGSVGVDMGSTFNLAGCEEDAGSSIPKEALRPVSTPNISNPLIKSTWHEQCPKSVPACVLVQNSAHMTRKSHISEAHH